MDTMEDSVSWCAEERPVYVTPSDQLDETCIEAIADAVDFWKTQGVTYLQLAVVPDWQVSDTIPNPRHINVSKTPPEDAGASGDTRVHRLTFECLDAAVIRLDPYWCRAGSNTAAHEIGHALGLTHVKDPRNLMYPATLPNSFALTPEQLAHVR